MYKNRPVSHRYGASLIIIGIVTRRSSFNYWGFSSQASLNLNMSWSRHRTNCDWKISALYCVILVTYRKSPMYFYTLISVHNRKRFFRFVFIMGTAMNYSFQSMIRRGMSKGRISLKIMKRSLKLFVLGIILNTNWGREYGLHNTKYICIDVTKPQLPTMRDIISNCYRNKSCGSSMEPIEMVSCMV